MCDFYMKESKKDNNS